MLLDLKFSKNNNNLLNYEFDIYSIVRKTEINQLKYTTDLPND